jgi:hypothetical protein
MLSGVKSSDYYRPVWTDNVEQRPRPAPWKISPPDIFCHDLIGERVGLNPIYCLARRGQEPLLKRRIPFAIPRGSIIKLIQCLLGELDPTHAGFGLFRSLDLL